MSKVSDNPNALHARVFRFKTDAKEHGWRFIYVHQRDKAYHFKKGDMLLRYYAKTHRATLETKNSFLEVKLMENRTKLPKILNMKSSIEKDQLSIFEKPSRPISMRGVATRQAFEHLTLQPERKANVRSRILIPTLPKTEKEVQEAIEYEVRRRLLLFFALCIILIAIGGIIALVVYLAQHNII